MDEVEAALESRGQLERKMGGSKRLRSWDVEVALDDLVEWDALEQFMSEMPATDGLPQQQSTAASSMGHSRPAYPSGSSTGGRGGDCGGGMNASSRAFPTLVPGAWPMMGSLDGSMGGGTMGPPNAAALAASLYPSWQQGLAGPSAFPLQALPMERGVSWGAELLPFIDEGDAGPLVSVLADPSRLDSPPSSDLARGGHMGGAGAVARATGMGGGGGGGGGGSGGGGAGDDGGGPGRPVHKQRFVWTGELHRRFEAAVNTLGVDQAKPQVAMHASTLALPRLSRHLAPSLSSSSFVSHLGSLRRQAISQLMNCEGEGAPTRQNIKSHLQKYRLLIQKRQQQGSSGDGRSGSGDKLGDSCSGGASGTGGGLDQTPTDVQSELEQHLARQEMNLRVQMDLQTKLHRQLLVQRQLQHQLEHCFPTPGSDPDKDKQRYQATLQLKNSLRERLTTHVMLQQEMLQHLDALVSSEVTKSADEPKEAPEAPEAPEAGAASVDTTSETVDTAADSDKADASVEETSA